VRNRVEGTRERVVSPAPAEAEFDYVVVGSGAGGGPVAANLAEAGHRVLLLEAGLDAPDDDYRVPASVLPRIPGFFIVSAIYMAAEKASAAIPADSARPPSVSHLLPRPRRPLRPTPVQETR